MKKSRYNTLRIILIFWCLFIGVGALSGGVCMLVRPDGSILRMQAMLPYFEVLPFSAVLFKNYVFPGIALIIVNGLTNITAAVLLLRKKKAGIVTGGIFGVTLMLWITIQFIIFPANALSTSYFIFGALQALTGYIAYVFYTQENFSFDASAYKNIGTNKNELTVYFSRMGYTKKCAYEVSDKSGACIYEIKTAERTEGTLGFWWCGRFAMHQWEMKLSGELPDVGKYDKVTVCTPVWAFGISAPVRAFLSGCKGKIKSTDYVFVHFMGSKFSSLADEADGLLGIRHGKATDICCRFGKTKTL